MTKYRTEAQALRWANWFISAGLVALVTALGSLAVNAFLKSPALELVFWPAMMVSVIGSYEAQGARNWIAWRQAALNVAKEGREP